MKYRKLMMGLTPVAIATPFATVMCSSLPQGAQKDITTKHMEEFVQESKGFSEYKTPERDLLKVTQNADINLFFNSWGTVTFTYMMRLAILANTEVHYGLVSNTDGLTHQDKVNIPEFSRFLKTRTVKGSDADKEVYPNSEVFTVGGDVDGRQVTEKWLDIIRKNPNKKINVFWNSGHLDHLNGGSISPTDLAGFKNVNLVLLEDGAVESNNIHTPATLAEDIKAADTREKVNNINQYFIPEKYENVYAYYSSQSNVNRLNTQGAKSIFHIDPQVLFEGFIRTKDVTGQTNLSVEWPKATGLDWRDAKATLDVISKNGKKSMIILGSYGVDEAPFLKTLYEKYGETYNLFYKGHPGHYQWNDFVERNYKGKINLLDPMISSEELTKENAEKGMYFDKVACVGWTSAIIGGFKNGYNDISHDLLATYIRGRMAFNKEDEGGTNQEIINSFGAVYWKTVTDAG